MGDQSEPQETLAEWLARADEAIEFLRHDAIAQISGGHHSDQNRLMFIEALCDAALVVKHPPAKEAALILAIAALGGEGTMIAVSSILKQWVVIQPAVIEGEGR